ncbi:hypothetical protein FLONG3_9106 [Fusarium longipes]|uniref:Uncharacterized protein n=1 Tax=Fusarium longipes TaxID=694270 RepID=A0A395RZY5_9HYPO|nr:hypothetical protein FLONG3_9106 [Fusarium longipes]
MEAADVPKWGFGQQPKGIDPVPNGFIPFFSTAGDNRLDADKISLSFDLVAPTSITRPAAWDRVPTLSFTANGKSRQIMKRVALCNERKAPQPFLILPQVNFAMPNTREAIALDQLLPRKLRRGPKFEPISREVAYSGHAISHAFMLRELMTATTHVANNYMNTSSCTSYEDRRAARRGICQITPLKRRADALDADSDIPVMVTPTGGNKLGFYYKVLPMIKKAYSKGKTEVDVATASMVEFSAYLRRRRRNPRQPLAAFGAPDLSDIMDESEPESPTVVREPVLKAESRSPAKRLARLTNPFSKSSPRGNRLAQGFVKLVPGLARGGFSTPVKARSSPVPQTASPVYDYAVASLQYSPDASDDDIPTSPKEGSPEPAEDLSFSPTRSPGRTFRVPSEFDSSSIAGDESIRGPPSTPNKSSPVNLSRPVAPTPSRWIRPEPTTPFTPMPQNAAPATPGETDSPIGLYSLIAPDTPKAPVCTYATPTGIDSINFGGESTFQSSVSWMNTSVQASEQARSQNTNNARRRRSEPLLRKSLETQARRRSASPQKLRFKSDDTFRDVISIASLFDLPDVETNDAEVNDAPVDEPTTEDPAPVEDADETIQDTDVSDAPVDAPVELTTDDPVPVADADKTIPDAPASAIDVEINMRENPDIFGTHPVSPPAPIQNLSQIAGNACNGHAKVVVTEENGRLFVRFKLSAEYGHMFPASQGFEDSDLTFSPSAVSSHPINAAVNNDPGFSPSAMSTPTFKSNSNHVSPVADHTLGDLLNTPDVTTPRAMDNSSPGFQTPELPPYYDNTLVFGEPSTTAQPTSTKRATRRQSAMTPLKRATANAMEAANRTTPGQSTAPNHSTPKFATPAADNADETLAISWSDVEDTPTQNSPAHNEQPVSAAPAEDEQAVSTTTAEDESPGREYMRNFIKRSRQPTTTETGSPLPPSVKRQPLGDRSPNRGTPSMTKRKHEGGDEEEGKPSPKKAKVEKTEAAPKKGKQTKTARQRSNLDIDMVDFPATQATELTTTTTTTTTDAASQAASPPMTRRSSRLRSQDSTGGPKSSLPTPIKLTRAGAGRASLARKPRSAEQELDRKTRSNTKKNMGDAESPAEVLTRIKGQAEEDSDVSEGSASGRRVGWKDPLEKVQGSSPKKGRATQGKTGVTKPKATRAAKVAEGSAKPQRVTRSRARNGV